jgi:hypothetical protein
MFENTRIYIFRKKDISLTSNKQDSTRGQFGDLHFGRITARKQSTKDDTGRTNGATMILETSRILLDILMDLGIPEAGDNGAWRAVTERYIVRCNENGIAHNDPTYQKVSVSSLYCLQYFFPLSQHFEIPAQVRQKFQSLMSRSAGARAMVDEFMASQVQVAVRWMVPPFAL